MDEEINLDRVMDRALRRSVRDLTGPPIKPRRLRCSNGHESDGAYVQMIGDHTYCTRCLMAMLDERGARMRDGT